MRLTRIRHALVAVFLLVAFFGQATGTLAATTGGLTGQVVNAQTNQPVGGAKVTATSPSATATVTADSSGHFTFLSLPPDTYLVSVSQNGFEPLSISGVTVISNENRQIPLAMTPALRVIGRVTSRAATDLVKPGTTADVYSVNPAQQAAAAPIGGGGNLNTAWSALATVPGVLVPPGMAGYIGAGPGLSIRGGDYDQVGYEVDGVPVNRSFDNYPSGSLSSLGQQELQVYTGAAPASAEAQGLSGFINQVIRTGTYPGFGNVEGAIGAPIYYHKASAEFGGATSSRNFSYYVGLGGYNQTFRYLDNFNGASVAPLYGVPLAFCNPALTPAQAPSCYTGGVYNGNTGLGSLVLGPTNVFAQDMVWNRDNVANFHFGFPHKDGTKDDIQLLGLIDHINTQAYSSINDMGGAAYLNTIGAGATQWIDGYQYNGKIGVPLPGNAAALTVPYFFPSSPAHPLDTAVTGFPATATLPANMQDAFQNNQAVYKLQWTHTMGQNALFRLYGYTYYSDWINWSPGSAWVLLGDYPIDYELESHARGVSGSFVDQINPQNLLTLQGNFTTASTIRDNNTQMLNGASGAMARQGIAVLVDPNNPTNGVCYDGTGAPTTCAISRGSSTGAAGRPFYVTLNQLATNTVPAAPAAICGTGPCTFFTVQNGLYATYNTVTPTFYSGSLTDQFRPNNKLTIDAGIRLDSYGFTAHNGQFQSAGRTLFYNSFNMSTCINNTTQLVSDKTSLGVPYNGTCPAGWSAITVANPTGDNTMTYNVWEPRIGFTYSVNPQTVVRASYGRFTQAPNSAFEEYDMLQADQPNQLYNTYGFQQYGFLSPNHNIPPATSNNLDLSLEHQFPGQWAMKLTPFYRKTQNQIQQFYLNQATSFVSGLPVGAQTSQGVEFEVDKGDFARNGLAAKFSFTYTNSYINYQTLSNGTTIITPLNNQIASYNAYTSACAPGGALVGKMQYGQPVCGTPQVAANSAQCFTPAGAADPTCAAGDIANPYWNAPAQGLLNPNANYPTFDLFPSALGATVGAGSAYGAPFVSTLLVQYKHDKWAFTPALQFLGGLKYGVPLTTFGVAPDTCTGILPGAVTTDPRYNVYQTPTAGGSPYDFATCGGNLAGVPNKYTKGFDSIGAFTAPAQLLLHAQVSYEASPNVTLVATMANIVNSCFGGTKAAWTVQGACQYGVPGAIFGDNGNMYNPGNPIQPLLNVPYAPVYNETPFAVYLAARIKL